jgi:hypothetical protein
MDESEFAAYFHLMMLQYLLNTTLGVADEIEKLMLENVGFPLLPLFKRVVGVDEIRALLGASFAYEM